MSETPFFSLPVDERRAPAFLDEIRGEEALAWVRERDEEAEARLGGPIREDLEARIHKVLTSPDRIPGVVLRREWAYNFWTDEDHPRGLWRRQLANDYLAGGEEWDVLLDLDALAEAEGRSWVFHGASVARPDWDLALIDLSDGGADADETREFSIPDRRFLSAAEGGFSRPASKGSLIRLERDLVWRCAAEEGTRVSTSGYPLEARLVPRGADPTSIAPRVVAAETDLGLFLGIDRDSDFPHTVVTAAHDFLNSTTWFVPHPIRPGTKEEDGRVLPVDAIRIDAPKDCGIGYWNGFLLLTPRTEWEVDGVSRPGGSLLAFEFEAFLAGSRAHVPLFLPDAHRALRALSSTRSRLILTTLEDVVTRLRVLAPPEEPGGEWAFEDLDPSALRITTPSRPLGDPGDEDGAPTPEDAREGARLEILPLTTASAGGAAPHDDERIWLTVSGFTTPTTLLLADLAEGPGLAPSSALLVRRAPEMFDARGVVAERHWATSADGTRVPYFQVGRPAGTPGANPTAPTLLYAYGGFEHATTPAYSGVVGRALLEKGGTYVLAGIRGGGEFGPEWHEAARGMNKERSYEDIEAVARDLVARGVSTPSRIGVRGGSNGGLMAANVYCRSPLLIGAAVVQAPLLDMKRYSHLSAGSSWIAEYGDPDDPEQWEAIRRFSPFHMWDPAMRYPPILITSSTADDRVHPAHARSFAWMLREGLADVTYFENVEGGHAGAADARDRAHVEALVWSFLWKVLGD